MTPEFIVTETPDGGGFEIVALTPCRETKLNWCPHLWDAYREIFNHVAAHMPRFPRGFTVTVIRPVQADGSQVPIDFSHEPRQAVEVQHAL